MRALFGGGGWYLQRLFTSRASGTRGNNTHAISVNIYGGDEIRGPVCVSYGVLTHAAEISDPQNPGAIVSRRHPSSNVFGSAAESAFAVFLTHLICVCSYSALLLSSNFLIANDGIICF